MCYKGQKTLWKKKKMTHSKILWEKKKVLVTKLMVINGGHLDFSHLSEVKNLYITEIYMKKKKQYKSSIIKNHEISEKSFFDGVPLKGYVAS